MPIKVKSWKTNTKRVCTSFFEKYFPSNGEVKFVAITDDKVLKTEYMTSRNFLANRSNKNIEM